MLALQDSHSYSCHTSLTSGYANGEPATAGRKENQQSFGGFAVALRAFYSCAPINGSDFAQVKGTGIMDIAKCFNNIDRLSARFAATVEAEGP